VNDGDACRSIVEFKYARSFLRQPGKGSMTNILVIFDPEREQREILTDILGRLGRVVFVTGLSPEDRARELASADVLISWSPARELRPDEFKTLTRARMMQLLSAGADHVPYSVLPPGLTIASNPGAYAEQMAEHVLAMILAITKNLLDRHEKLTRGIFDQVNENRMLRGSNCVILGFGGIGKTTARLLRCFGVEIYGINTTGKTDEPVKFIGTLKDLENVLRLADIVIIALPLTNSTRALIGRRELDSMKDDAILVNVARGEIIDEGALYQKLKAFPNFAAAIDAWWIEPLSHGEFRTNYPFFELPNVLGSPHNSGNIHGSFAKGTMLAAENVKRFLNREPVLGIIRRSDYE
jgi:phosphoglycerate dehydrogenase-like enzyme